MSHKDTHSFIVTLKLPDSDGGYVYSEAEHKEYVEERLDLWAEDGYTVTPANHLTRKLAIAVEALEFYSDDFDVKKIDGQYWICPKKDLKLKEPIYFAIKKHAREALAKIRGGGE